MFSIIIITYNQIDETLYILESIEHQTTTKPFEVIVVDDGSDIRFSTKLYKKYSFKLSVEYLSRNVDSSRARTRNFGARLASGEYLIFIDGDTLPDKKLIETYDSYFKLRKSRDVVLGVRTDLSRDQTYLALKHNKNYLNLLNVNSEESDFRLDYLRKSKKTLSELNMAWFFFVSCNFCIRRRQFLSIGGFDEQFIGWGSEDTELGYRLLKNNIKYDIIECKSYHFYSFKESPNEEDKLRSWIKNVGLFYLKHQDKRILYLFTVFDIIFNSFYKRMDWDFESFSNQVNLFFSRTNL